MDARFGGVIVYICLDCCETFEEPKRYTETHGLDSPPYEEWNGCPYCGGSYSTTYKGDGCGKWIDGEFVEILPSHEVYCDRCFELKDIED